MTTPIPPSSGNFKPEGMSFEASQSNPFPNLSGFSHALANVQTYLTQGDYQAAADAWQSVIQQYPLQTAQDHGQTIITGVGGLSDAFNSFLSAEENGSDMAPGVRAMVTDYAHLLGDSYSWQSLGGGQDALIFEGATGTTSLSNDLTNAINGSSVDFSVNKQFLTAVYEFSQDLSQGNPG